MNKRKARAAPACRLRDGGAGAAGAAAPWARTKPQRLRGVCMPRATAELAGRHFRSGINAAIIVSARGRTGRAPARLLGSHLPAHRIRQAALGDAWAALFANAPFGFGSNQTTASWLPSTRHAPAGFSSRAFPPPYLVQGAGRPRPASTTRRRCCRRCATMSISTCSTAAMCGSAWGRSSTHRQFRLLRQPRDRHQARARHGFRRCRWLSHHRDRWRGSYWDGGLVSNTPLTKVLAVHLMRDTLAFQVDLWPARGPLPTSAWKRWRSARRTSSTPAARASSPSTFRRQLKLRRSLQRVLDRLPTRVRSSPSWPRSGARPTGQRGQPHLRGQPVRTPFQGTTSSIPSRCGSTGASAWPT